jgi:hypothetical protein
MKKKTVQNKKIEIKRIRINSTYKLNEIKYLSMKL